MSDARFDVNIGSDVRVGDPSFTSTLSIAIKNNTGRSDLKPNFSLTIPRQFVAKKQVREINFVLSHTSGNELVKQYVATRSFLEKDTPSADGTRWFFWLPVKFPAGDTITLQLSRITAASEGEQTIEIALDPTWAKKKANKSVLLTVAPDPPVVKVREATDTPKITNFKAAKYYNLPGTPIELSWETDNESVVELRRFDTPCKLTGDKSQSYRDTTRNLSGLQLYQLKATANQGMPTERTVSQWLFVEVQLEGWYRIDECPWGAPTLLLNDHDNALYGIFLKDGNAAVYQLDPENGVMGQEDRKLEVGDVPKALQTSPGAFFESKLWLVGGSQIDPDVCSNTVWCFDPAHPNTRGEAVETTGTNLNKEKKMWSPRMGHACVKFDHKIMILGGRDEDGNVLDEVWESDNGRHWTQTTPLPHRVCLLTAASFKDSNDKITRLWIHGGVDRPFGTPQQSLWYRTKDNAAWTQMKFNSQGGAVIGYPQAFGEPFASALCVAKKEEKQLCCLATSLTSSGLVESQMFGLSGMDYDRSSADLTKLSSIDKKDVWPTTEGDHTQHQQSFRLSAVAFKGFIFVVSLVYGTEHPSLTYRIQ